MNRVHKLTLIAGCLAALAGCGDAAGPDTDTDAKTPYDEVVYDAPPTELQLEMSSMTSAMIPLFVLGDVNEDGAIDASDRAALMGATAPTAGATSSDLGCESAGDLNLDGEVDADDVEAFDVLFGENEVYAQPLFAQPYGRCGYSNRFLAGSAEWIEGEPVSFRLIGGFSVEEVEIEVVTEGAYVEYREDGWDVWLPEDLGRADIASMLFFANGSTYLYSMTRQQDDQPEEETWINAGRTDLNGDGDDGDDPRDTPPPTVYGEEIDDLEECPQDGMGCEALIIDFAKATLHEFDSDQTTAALRKIGCNVVHVAPSFVSIPKPVTVWLITLNGLEERTINPSTASVNRAKATNRAQWAAVRTAIATHRANLQDGRDLAYTHVNAHGSRGAFSCGIWGPAISTGAGSLRRSDFHWGNYIMGRAKVCNAVNHDWSCYSGNSPKLLNELNNTGLGTCSANVPENHGFHAAFWGDMAGSSAPTTETCSNGEILVRDISNAGMIKRTGRYKDYDTVATGFRTAIIDGADGVYNDRGYNLKGGTSCSAHIAKY